MMSELAANLSLLREVKGLAVKYYQQTGKPLGVTGEIAECEAAALMNLTLAPPREAGFDAFGTDGRKVQIKGRWKKEGRNFGRVPKINTDKAFDTTMLVLMIGNYEVFEIWEADRSDIIARLDKPGSKARNERRSMDVSQFKTIARLVWSRA